MIDPLVICADRQLIAYERALNHFDNLCEPTHTLPNSPVISIINRSISALIRSPLNYRSNRAPLWNVMRPGKDTGCILT